MNIITSKTEAKVLNIKDPELIINSKIVSINQETKHLGLELSSSSIRAEKIIIKSRKTIYSLMETGILGKNGSNPIVSRKIWERYNIPRSTHGLEVQILSETEMKKLIVHKQEFLKMF